jgi:DNA-binding CsgD family transcriptional regulator
MYKVVVIDGSGRMRECLNKGEMAIVAEVADLQSLHKLQYKYDAVLISEKNFTQILSKNTENKRKLTKLEKLILAYKKQGKTNQEIADILVITRKAVEKHITKINHKLGTKNIREALAKVDLE